MHRGKRLGTGRHCSTNCNGAAQPGGGGGGGGPHRWSAAGGGGKRAGELLAGFDFPIFTVVSPAGQPTCAKIRCQLKSSSGRRAQLARRWRARTRGTGAPPARLSFKAAAAHGARPRPNHQQPRASVRCTQIWPRSSKCRANYLWGSTGGRTQGSAPRPRAAVVQKQQAKASAHTHWRRPGGVLAAGHNNGSQFLSSTRVSTTSNAKNQHNQRATPPGPNTATSATLFIIRTLVLSFPLLLHDCRWTTITS